MRILGVSEVTRAIRGAIREDPRLADLWVEGEIGRVTVSSAGHAYFTLKDERSQLQCVWFRDDRLRSVFEAQAGLRVVAHGRIDLFEPQGALQLYVDSIQPAGVGDLTLRFEELKARLAAEGLFDAGPQAAAARRDRRRSPSSRARPARSGRTSPRPRAPLAAGPRRPGRGAGPGRGGARRASWRRSARLERYRDELRRAGRAPTTPQVTILARGGGSLEDLWSFNDERVVRAVVAHPIPVVCGVGHEIDVTLADFAADVRAPTPSAAAEIVVPDRAEMAGRAPAGRRATRRRDRGAADIARRPRPRRRATGAGPAQPGGPARRVARAGGLLFDRATRALDGSRRRAIAAPARTAARVAPCRALDRRRGSPPARSRRSDAGRRRRSPCSGRRPRSIAATRSSGGDRDGGDRPRPGRCARRDRPRPPRRRGGSIGATVDEPDVAATGGARDLRSWSSS